MYKIKIIILAITLTLLGCKKEEPEPEPEVAPVNCYCGSVELTSRSWSTSTGQVVRWYYLSRNNCTNAPIRFETQTEFTESEYCLTYQW